MRIGPYVEMKKDKGKEKATAFLVMRAQLLAQQAAPPQNARQDITTMLL
jgi:hypothetical protein